MENNITAPYGWIFTYSPYAKLWQATQRNNYFDLFNERGSAAVISNASFEALLENINSIDALTNK